jgi:hypothetical protein
VTIPSEITVQIDRLVVETDHPVDGFALQRALGDAIRDVVTERGLPSCWQSDGSVPLAVVDGLAWDGQGGEPGLARALAVRLYEGGFS